MSPHWRSLGEGEEEHGAWPLRSGEEPAKRTERQPKAERGERGGAGSEQGERRRVDAGLVLEVAPAWS